MQRATGRTHAHHEFEAQVPHLIQKGSSFKTTVCQHANPKSSSNAVWNRAKQLTGEGDRSRCPFPFVHSVAHGEFDRTIFSEEDDQMDAVNVVVDADEGQGAALLFDAGQVDTQSEEGTMFAAGGQEQGVPLGTLQHRPTLRCVPVVLVEKTTQRTLADEFSPVECRFGGRVEEQSERSPEAALLVRRGGDRQELICQNADALPRNL
ncbi:hypothetical protein Dxin01_02745 [Deinococcus xinjiangensis]|uniref:Uncharacterized protein n=1 Tax=Deinococcus xinjiangensis TaxID=457454 RepID=A0ABP9VCM8_9DEIO